MRCKLTLHIPICSKVFIMESTIAINIVLPSLIFAAQTQKMSPNVTSRFLQIVVALASSSLLLRSINAEGVDAANVRVHYVINELRPRSITKAYQCCLGQHTSVCVTTQEEIAALLVNQDQLENGVEGGTLVTNYCSKLIAADVMNYRSDEDQAAICSNSCFSTLNEKYKALLDNDCFTDEAEGDADEAASSRLQAAAYQFACQTRADGKYCGKSKSSVSTGK